MCVNGKQYSSRIGPLKDHNDSEVLDDGLKAKLFNQYFSNIGKDMLKAFLRRINTPSYL